MPESTGPILIVDDDRDTRDFLVLFLGLLGYAAVTACDRSPTGGARGTNAAKRRSRFGTPAG